MFTAKPDPDCEECGGDGYVEIQITVDDFRKITCECNDYEPDPDNQHDDCETDEK